MISTASKNGSLRGAFFVLDRYLPLIAANRYFIDIATSKIQPLFHTGTCGYMIFPCKPTSGHLPGLSRASLQFFEPLTILCPSVIPVSKKIMLNLKSLTTMKKQLPSTINEIQVSYKQNVLPGLETITDAQGAADIFRSIFPDLSFVEYFYILLLNRKNAVIGYYQVSKGGMAGTLADPKVIFSVALKAAATSMIICHNHPSGNMRPSEQDIRLTRKLKEAGTILELPVLDHIILSPEEDTFLSFANEGLI